jgi:hypothetical protein
MLSLRRRYCQNYRVSIRYTRLNRSYDGSGYALAEKTITSVEVGHSLPKTSTVSACDPLAWSMQVLREGEPRVPHGREHGLAVVTIGIFCL